MRKRYLLVGILAILTLAGVWGIRYADARRAVLQIDARKTPYIDVRTGQGSSAVRPWGGTMIPGHGFSCLPASKATR